MSTAPALETVQSFLTAMERKDFDTALTYVTEDCQYDNVAMGKVEGHAGVRAVLEPFFGAIAENVFVVERSAVNGDVVFLERTDRHLMEHGWRELRVTGVFELRDGRIAVWNEYFDKAQAEALYAPA